METKADSVPQLSILLVEDEEIDREILATALACKFPAVTLHTARDGRTGLELFKTHRPEIVITDINMPEIGGFQLAVNIRSLKPDTKLIVLTGCTGEDVKGDSVAKEFDIDHFILKPVIFHELFAAIERCIGEIVQQTRR